MILTRIQSASLLAGFDVRNCPGLREVVDVSIHHINQMPVCEDNPFKVSLAPLDYGEMVFHYDSGTYEDMCIFMENRGWKEDSDNKYSRTVGFCKYCDETMLVKYTEECEELENMKDVIIDNEDECGKKPLFIDDQEDLNFIGYHYGKILKRHGITPVKKLCGYEIKAQMLDRSGCILYNQPDLILSANGVDVKHKKKLKAIDQIKRTMKKRHITFEDLKDC